MRAWIQLLRPLQWLKNLVVLAGLLFAQRLTDTGAVIQSLGAFGAFCLGSSSMYVLNDLLDRERDKLHPTKKDRPLAAGLISPFSASICFIVLAGASLALAFSIREAFFSVLLAYLLLTAAYSFLLKKVVILDVIIIATGFVLRAVGGTVAIQVPISPWLLL